MTSLLIVDDSPIDRRLAAGLLHRDESWTIRTAEDGAEALAMIAESPPDCIITDLQMPNVNGLELVSTVRRQFSHVPIVLMTAQGSEEIAVQALQAGAASYVPKRTLAAELLSTVRRVVSAATEERSQSALMNRLEQRTETFRIETDLTLVMAVSRYIQDALGDSWSLDRTERLRIGTALEEALLNAYYHGNLEVSSDLKETDYSAFYGLAERRCQEVPYSQRGIFVRLEITPVATSVTIRDEGPGFDPAQLPDPTDLENLDRPCGRGVMLMRAFMDDVTYNERGNEVRLSRRRFRN